MVLNLKKGARSELGVVSTFQPRPFPLQEMVDPYFVAEIQKGLTDNGVLSYIRGKIWNEVGAARELPSDAEGLEIFIRKALQTSC